MEGARRQASNDFLNAVWDVAGTPSCGGFLSTGFSGRQSTLRILPKVHPVKSVAAILLLRTAI